MPNVYSEQADCADAVCRERACEPRDTASALGLVPYETSVTVKRASSRLRRMRRSVLTSARLLQDEASKGGFRHYCAMLTLTYASGHEWKPKHITTLVHRIRQWLKRRNKVLRYVRVMELTQAGVPHFHVLIWLPHRTKLPKPDERGWWPHGMTRIEKAVAPIRYITKYASKGTDCNRLPKGARLQSSGGLSKAGRAERSWWMAPRYVRERWAIEDLPCRAPGGGWVSRVSGDWIPSPWIMIAHAQDWSWVKLGRRDALVDA